MAKPSQTHKQVRILCGGDEKHHPDGSARVVTGHNENGPTFGKVGEVVTFPNWEANSLIVAGLAEAFTKGGK